MTLVFITVFTAALKVFSTSGHHFSVCFNSSKPTGLYLGYEYQIVYSRMKDVLELNCSRCHQNETMNSTMIWSKMTLNPYGLNIAFHGFKTKKKKFKKRFRILENGAFRFKKINTKDAGLYVCNVTNEDEEVFDFVSYFVHVFPKSFAFERGTVTKWLSYQNQTIAPAREALRNESSEDPRVSLSVETSGWGPCVCGVIKFDTKRFRMKHPFVRIDHDGKNSIILHVKSPKLEELHPNLYYSVENVTSFQEYEPCFDNCVPDVLQNDDEYRYSETVYIPEGTNYKLICPEYLKPNKPSNSGSKFHSFRSAPEDSEVLWIREDEVILRNLETNGSDRSVARNHFYLFNIKPGEEGKYSCLVDNFPMKEFIVTVVSKHILLTEECHEGLINVGYVLCLSLVVWLIILIQKVWSEV